MTGASRADSEQVASTVTRGGASAPVSAVARGGVLSLAGAVVSAATNLVLVLVVAHGTSKTTAGEFFALTSVFLLAETLCRLGGDTGLVFFVARWRATGRTERIMAALRSALLVAIGSGVVLAIVLIGVAGPLSRLLGAGHSTGLLRIVAVALPVAVGYDLALAFTRGASRMRPTVLIEKLVRPALQLVLVAVVIGMGWDGGLGLAWALPYAVAAILAWQALRSALTAIPRHAAPRDDSEGRADEGRVGRQFWRFSAPRAVAGAAQLLLQRLDIVLVAALRSPAEAAVYTAATRFLVASQFVNQAISAPLQPRLSAALAVQDLRQARELYRVSTAWLVMLTWPLFGLAAVFASSYLRLFGGAYASGRAVVEILATVMLVATGCGAVDSVITMAGRTTWNLGTTLLALTVNVAVDVALIPSHGIVGAAIGWAASIVAANLVPLVLVRTSLRLDPFGRGTVEVMVAAAFCFVLLPLVLGATIGNGQVGRLIGAGVGLALYGAVLVLRRGTLYLSRDMIRRPAVTT